MKMKRFLIAALALALLIAFAPSLPLHTASAATVVTGVTITGIDAPVAGAKPDYTASGSGAGYYVEDDYTSGTEWRNGVEWYDETAKKWLAADTDTFTAGHQYTVVVSVMAKSGYTFSKSGSTGTINGKTAEVYQVWKSDNAGFSYTFPAVQAGTQTITGVTITGIDAPKAGARPDYVASLSGGEGLSFEAHHFGNDSWQDGVLWNDDTTRRSLLPSDTFTLGHQYTVYVDVLISGGSFSNSCSATINGKTADIGNLKSNELVCSYTFPAVAEESEYGKVINKVTITGVTAPVEGEKPNYNVTVKGEGFTVEDYNDNDWVHGVAWHDMADGESDNMKPDDTFKAGHTYRIGISLQPNEGYTFENSSGDVVTAGTINGEKVTETYAYSDGTVAYRYTFPAVRHTTTDDGSKAIDNVIIAIKPPYSLHTPSYSATVTGEGVVLNDYTFMDNVTKWEHGVNWYDRTNNSSLGRMGLDATFVQLNYYTVNVMVKAAAGYGFTTDTKVTVNGQEGKISISGDNATCSFNFPFCTPEPVNIQVTVTEPVAGEKPSYEYTVSGEGGGVMDYNENGYVHGVLWHDQTEDKDMTPSDVFVAGHKYKVKVASYIADGYYADRMHGSFSINGQGSPYYGTEAVFECKASPHLFPVDYYGFAEYEGGLFIVYQGDVVTSLNGLVQDPNHPETWYFCSNGQAQLQYTGLAEYGGEWFYVDKGVCDVNRVGAVEYNGGTFIVAAGRWIQEYTGLIQDPNTGIWYFVVGGQVQTGYTGLAQYDGAWFYLINGVLAVDYTGPVVYDGSTFNVVNGQVA